MTTTNSSSEKRKQTLLLSALDNYGGDPFNELFDTVFPCYGAEEVEAAVDLVETVVLVIWGGGDISPTIYDQVPNKFTGASEILSKRDQLEMEMALKAMELGIPIIGICRGAQLMCALSGGTLVQHVENHAGGYHPISTADGRNYNCPSLHHQMMFPWPRDGKGGCEFEMIAWSTKPRSTVYFVEPYDDGAGGEGSKHFPKEVEIPNKQEPEIIWIPKSKALCIQSHPEFIASREHPFVQYTLELTNRYIFGKKDDANRG